MAEISRGYSGPAQYQQRKWDTHTLWGSPDENDNAELARAVTIGTYRSVHKPACRTNPGQHLSVTRSSIAFEQIPQI